MRLQSRENPGHLYSRGGEGSPSPALGKEGIYLTEVAGRLCRDLLTVLSGAAYRGKKGIRRCQGDFLFFSPAHCVFAVPLPPNAFRRGPILLSCLPRLSTHLPQHPPPLAASCQRRLLLPLAIAKRNSLSESGVDNARFCLGRGR